MITVPNASQVYTHSKVGPCVTGMFNRVVRDRFSWCRVDFQAEYIEFDMMWITFHDAFFVETVSSGGWRPPPTQLAIPGIHRIPSRLVRDITYDTCPANLALTA